jgi:DnaK suppressor protein
MVSPQEQEDLRKRLKERRAEILDLRQTLDKSLKQLNLPEVEYEESAQKEKMAKGLDRLDQREKEEIEAIDRALARMELGKYGTCLFCGETISSERLQAIPWAESCIQCAKAEKEKK